MTDNRVTTTYKKHLIGVPYPIKQNYNIQIPLNIFQTWHTKLLPPLMFQAVQKIKQNNPRFNYFLFDDNDCREFIAKHFEPIVLKAYDSLIPGAYKADLWRYCVLYINGGIYLDIKYVPINSFKFINLVEQEHWVLDHGGQGIYNALMVCKPQNNILNKAIYKIVDNVRNKYYGTSFLEPTGPTLLIKYFNDEDIQQIQTKHYYVDDTGERFILFNNYYILEMYSGYIKEHSLYTKIPHYSKLWRKHAIYK